MIEGERVSCGNCTGACCRETVSMPLSDAEHQHLLDGGTELHPLIGDSLFRLTEIQFGDDGNINKISSRQADNMSWRERIKYYKEMAAEFDRQQDHPKIAEAFRREAKLAAEQKRTYMLDSDCGYLDQETYACTAYNERPDICRGFEEGGYLCKVIRESFDVEPVPVEVHFRARNQ